MLKQNDGYKDVVDALNSLQTNAQLLQQVKVNKQIGQENNIEQTKLYLSRTGVSVDQLDRGLSVIHVTGTKGKGSTCAICESILHNRGYKTGFYSSPHLVAVRERIRINKKPLSETDFTRYFWKVYNKLIAAKEHENDMPAYFKFLTVMAFNVFLEEKVDVAIIEVGIGGKYDCTNVFRRTAVVGISSLGLDHTMLLGHTLEEIAKQKSGIMKPGCLAFTSPQPPAALHILHQSAIQRQCSLWEVPPLRDYDWQGRKIEVGLVGEVQALNASLALQLCNAWINRKELGEKSYFGLLGLAKTLKIDETTAEGLKHCSWPGRFQILKRKSINGTFTYYIDGAHTSESIQLCAHWFDQETNNIISRHSCWHTLVYNLTGNRDPKELLAPLISCCFDSVYFCPNIIDFDSQHPDLRNNMVTSVQQQSRCESNRQTWIALEKQRNVFAREVRIFPTVMETLHHIERRTGEQKVLVTGSLHLVGNVLTVLDPDLNCMMPASSIK